MIALLSFLLSLRIAWKLAGFPFCPYDLVIPNCGRMNRNNMCASTLNVLYLRLKLASSYNKTMRLAIFMSAGRPTHANGVL